MTIGERDAQNDVFVSGCLSSKRKTVPVLIDFDVNTTVGFVSEITQNDNKIMCRADIYEDCIGMYPCIGFKIIKSRFHEGVRLIEEMEIYSVGLTIKENVDPSISPIL